MDVRFSGKARKVPLIKFCILADDLLSSSGIVEKLSLVLSWISNEDTLLCM